MSLVQKLLPHRSGYTLAVNDIKLSAGARQLRLAPYSAVGKRALAGLLAFAFVAMTVVSGFFMTTAASPKASANWISDIFCTPLGNGGGAEGTPMDNVYGGVSGGNVAWILGRSVALGGASGLLGAGSTGGILDIRLDKNVNKKTAYEAYTPFLPVFDAYIGYYVDPADNNDKITVKYPTAIKDGKPTGTVLEATYNGNPYEVGQSYLFSHDVGTDCLAGAAGKSFAINVSNSMFMLPKLVTFFSAEVYGWAIQNAAISEDGSALHGLLYGDNAKNDNGLNAIITGTDNAKGLKDVLYLPFLLPIVMLSALYIAYQALFKNRTSSATGSAIWLVAASITGVLFLSNPQVIPEVADTIVTSVNSATTKALNGGGSSTTLCNLSSTPSVNQLAREVKCEIWYNTIYVPWVSGQFGVGTKINGGNDVLTQNAGFTNKGKGATANNTILDSMTLQLGGNPIANDKSLAATADPEKRWAVNWGTFELQQQIANVNGTKANQFTALAFSQLSGNAGANLNQTWGGDPLRQFNAALLAAIASVGTLIIVLSTGFLLIGYQISVIFLLMLAPFFFLIGAIPGIGRGIMMRWFELIAATIIKRILLTFILSVFLRLYAMVMELQNIDWWLKVVILIILSVVAMSQRSNLINAFVKTIDFGGNKNLGDGTDGVRTLGKRLATGAALAGMSAVGARAGFGAVGGAAAGNGNKLRSAAGALSNLTNRNGKGGAAGGVAGGVAGGKGTGAGGSIAGDGTNGIDPTTGGTDVNGIPTGDTRPETDGAKVITRELPPFIDGERYEAQIIVYGNPQPSISVSGLPNGLSVNASDGKITGTPNVQARGEVSIKIDITVKAENIHGNDSVEFEVEGFSAPKDVPGRDPGRQQSYINKAKESYTQGVRENGSDISRAKDLAADAAYERASLNAKDAGKPNAVKAKHSPEAYRKEMEAEIGPRPTMSTYVNESGKLDRNAYALALDDYNTKAEGYKAAKPYGEFAKDSLESRARRKAEITGTVDPDDQKRLEARAKAMRQAAMNGIQRGFVDNKDGNVGVNRGELFNAYRGSYQFGDQKSTSAAIKLDAARDRQEAAESRSMLQRQIELQEAGLRLQGWNPDDNGTLPPAPNGTVPPPPASGPTPPSGGGSGGGAPIGGAPVAPVRSVSPAQSAPPANAPSPQAPTRQMPQAPIDNSPAFVVGPPTPQVQAAPVSPVPTPTTPAQREQLTREIAQARQQGAQRFAEQTGGPVQPVVIPPRPNNIQRRATMTPPVTAPAAPIQAPVVAQRPVIITSGDVRSPAPAPQAPDMIEYVEQTDAVQQVVSAPVASKKPITAPIPAAPRQQQTQQQRNVPAPVAPKKPATQTDQRQQQPQQQLRTAPAPAAPAPKKPVVPVPAAPKPPKQQQQTVSAPAAPKKPKRPVTLNINVQNPPVLQEPTVQPAAAASPLADNKVYIDNKMTQVYQQYVNDLPFKNGHGNPIRIIENWRRVYEPYNRELRVFLTQAEQYNQTVSPEQQIDLSQYRYIDEP